jgi:hypothetical protein
MSPKIGRIICWVVFVVVSGVVMIAGWQFTDAAVVPSGAYVVLAWVPIVAGFGAGFLAMLLAFLLLTRKEK